MTVELVPPDVSLSEGAVIGAEECVFCGRPSEGIYAIHKDSSMDGEEVPLCDACGSKPTPTCAEIWAKIEEDAE